MIVDERMTTYINSLDTENSAFLENLEREAMKAFVPIIRREMQSFLKAILAIKQPLKILEVGTAIGFSALLMCENTAAQCHITTIENYQERIPLAKENFRQANYEQKVTLLEGDANDILKELDGPYDFIFMDAAKGQYVKFLPEVVRLMEKGAVLISDNVLQDGDIIESHFAIERRNRTIHKRMRDYLYQIKHHQQLTTSIIPLGDGVTLSVKR